MLLLIHSFLVIKIHLIELFDRIYQISGEKIANFTFLTN